MYLVVAAVVAVLLYLLFRDTMNRLQYIQTLRIYWITKNNANKKDRTITRASMRQTAEPWWQGSGLQVRFGSYSFQFGILKGKGSSLLDQLGGRDLEETPQDLRKWVIK